MEFSTLVESYWNRHCFFLCISDCCCPSGRMYFPVCDTMEFTWFCYVPHCCCATWTGTYSARAPAVCCNPCLLSFVVASSVATPLVIPFDPYPRRNPFWSVGSGWKRIVWLKTVHLDTPSGGSCGKPCNADADTSQDGHAMQHCEVRTNVEARQRT